MEVDMEEDRTIESDELSTLAMCSIRTTARLDQLFYNLRLNVKPGVFIREFSIGMGQQTRAMYLQKTWMTVQIVS
jgi:hypothetical protein